jgi:hypothetical protein
MSVKGEGVRRPKSKGGVEVYPEPIPEQESFSPGPTHEEDSMRTKRVALCFSGGGIRSAFFQAGVLEELCNPEHKELLEDIDIISCVSGGGYTGSGLMAFVTEAQGNVQAGLRAFVSHMSKRSNPRHLNIVFAAIVATNIVIAYLNWKVVAVLLYDMFHEFVGIPDDNPWKQNPDTKKWYCTKNYIWECYVPQSDTYWWSIVVLGSFVVVGIFLKCIQYLYCPHLDEDAEDSPDVIDDWKFAEEGINLDWDEKEIDQRHAHGFSDKLPESTRRQVRRIRRQEKNSPNVFDKVDKKLNPKRWDISKANKYQNAMWNLGLFIIVMLVMGELLYLARIGFLLQSNASVSLLSQDVGVEIALAVAFFVWLLFGAGCIPRPAMAKVIVVLLNTLFIGAFLISVIVTNHGAEDGSISLWFVFKRYTITWYKELAALIFMLLVLMEFTVFHMFNDFYSQNLRETFYPPGFYDCLSEVSPRPALYLNGCAQFSQHSRMVVFSQKNCFVLPERLGTYRDAPLEGYIASSTARCECFSQTPPITPWLRSKLPWLFYGPRLHHFSGISGAAISVSMGEISILDNPITRLLFWLVNCTLGRWIAISKIHMASRLLAFLIDCGLAVCLLYDICQYYALISMFLYLVVLPFGNGMIPRVIVFLRDSVSILEQYLWRNHIQCILFNLCVQLFC